MTEKNIFYHLTDTTSPESTQTLLILSKCGRQDFDRDVPLQPRISCPIHLPHAADSQERQQVVGADVPIHPRSSGALSQVAYSLIDGRPFQKTLRSLVFVQQGLHFTSQRLIAGTGFLKKPIPFVPSAFEGALIQFLHLSPALRRHPSPLNSRLFAVSRRDYMHTRLPMIVLRRFIRLYP